VAKKEPIKPSITWSCCEQYFESVKDLAEHLKIVHKVEPKNGSRRATMHVDAANFYTTQYEWTIEGIKFFQTCVMPR